MLFNNPIVTNVTLTLGTDVLFSFDGTTASGTTKTIRRHTTWSSPTTSSTPSRSRSSTPLPILPGPNGTAERDAQGHCHVGTAFTGSVATFSDSDTTAKASQFTATINWGDGHISNGTVKSNARADSTSWVRTPSRPPVWSRPACTSRTSAELPTSTWPA